MLKDFSKGEKAVYGVFTRDYRINALEARILVTVPACLEILLFSPAHRDWVKKLRYVIFDEVHCMREGGIREGGTVENTGAIWEHCLLLIRYLLCMLLLYAAQPLNWAVGWLLLCGKELVLLLGKNELSRCESSMLAGSCSIGAFLKSSSCPVWLALSNIRVIIRRWTHLRPPMAVAQTFSLLRSSAANTEASAYHHAHNFKADLMFDT